MTEVVTTRNGRTVLLRPACEDDALGLIQAMDRVARELVFFRRSTFLIDEAEERAFISKAKDRGHLVLVAIDREPVDQVVGWLILLRAGQEFSRHTAELAMGVVNGYRECGIGRALMAYGLRWAQRAGLEKITLGVRAGNARARALYAKMGFGEEGRRLRQVKGHDGEYEDEILMGFFPQGEE